MTVKSEVQGVVQALFGAYAGGYLAELTAEATANGSAAVAARLVTIQGIILGRDMSDNQTFVDTILNNLGVPSTNAAYEAAAAWAMGELTAGASRADIVSAAVAFLDGIAAGTIVDSKYTAIAEAFAASVEAGIEYSEGEGAEVFGLDDLQAAAAIAAPFNLTAALATLGTANDAVESFLKALDLNADGKADNAGDVDLNRADLTEEQNGALDDAIIAVGEDVNTANGTTLNWFNLTDAQRDAELAKAKVNLAAEVTNAQTDVDTAYAAMSAALKTAITAYEAADTTLKAATTAEGKTDADLIAAIAKYNLDSATDITFAPGATDSASDAAKTAFASVITIDPVKYTAALATDVTETTNPGITAVLTALQADLAAEKALSTATTNMGTAQVNLDAADGGADDVGTDGDMGEAEVAFVLAADAPTYNAYLADKTTLKNATDAVTKLEKDVAALTAIQDEAATLKTLDKAVTSAESAVGAAGFDLNNANGSLNLNPTVDSDFTDAGEYDFTSNTAAAELAEKEVYTVDYGTRSVDAFQAGDVIALGGYTYNTGKVATDGNNNVLEFFLNETVDGNLEVIMEEVAFGSNSAAHEYITITLTGVTMDEVVVGSNYITLA